MAGNKADDVDAGIGACVKKLREQRGVTRDELAGRIGCSRQQVIRYEEGEHRIAASMLLRIADALGCPVEFFFPGPL